MSEAWRVSSLNPKEHSLEEVSLWGLRPVLVMLEIVEDDITEFDTREFLDPEKLTHLANEIRAKIEDTVGKMDEFGIYLAQLKNRLQELSPNDPLLMGE